MNGDAGRNATGGGAVVLGMSETVTLKSGAKCPTAVVVMVMQP